MKKVLLLGLVFSILASSLVQAQRRSLRRSYNSVFGIWKFTAGAGIASYKGDIGDRPRFKVEEVRPNLYVGAQYRLTSRVSARGEVGWYQISGDDKNGVNPQRNLSFRSNNFEGFAALMYDFVPYTRRYSRIPTFPVAPYVFGGLGFTTVNPQAKYTDGVWYSLRSYQTEGKSYSPITLTIPIGAGLRYKLTNVFDISFEVSYRFTLTDYLDDVSGNYAPDWINGKGTTGDPIRDHFISGGVPYTSLLNSDEEVNTKRGNPSNKDGYFTMCIKLEYNTVPNGNSLRKNPPRRRVPKYRRRF
jgi:opacity protein-like surface antigen